MNEAINALEPAVVWKHFTDLNAVPRPSKKETRVIDFITAFGKGLGLPTTTDEAGNVIIRKAATAGMEKCMPVILQSHLDMVHQKNADTNFDFDLQGIQMFIDGDWVKAKGTTLGADNGIGVATIMALLASTMIPHPALEALFTVDEETGMTGALALKAGLLQGKILLNLDTEEDNELTIGCAGGIDVTASGSYEAEPAGNGLTAYRIEVKGLTGGHSGVDIHKGRGNANKLMNRLLYELKKQLEIRIASIDGGSLRNAIPRESVAVIVLAKDHSQLLQQTINDFTAIMKGEYRSTDPGLKLTVSPTDMPGSFLPAVFQQQFLSAFYACPNGIYRMSPDINGLVQSSNNIARVIVQGGNWNVQCLTRSSVNSEKTDLANAVAAGFEQIGGTVKYSGLYPGWEPRSDAGIVELMKTVYETLFHEVPHVNAVHAGLECGIIGRNYPDVQIISFGPNIYGAHSPDEKVQVSSVQKFWTLLLETLKRIPENI